jgi:ribosomal protein S27E
MSYPGILYMKIRCPDCKNAAELSDDFSFVKCPECSFEMSYGSYVKYVAYKDARYKNILEDYKPRKNIDSR